MGLCRLATSERLRGRGEVELEECDPDGTADNGEVERNAEVGGGMERSLSPRMASDMGVCFGGASDGCGAGTVCAAGPE